MIYKEILSGNKKAQIYRQKSNIRAGYDYYILILNLNCFGHWVINESFKQKLDISSESVAVRICNDLLNCTL